MLPPRTGRALALLLLLVCCRPAPAQPAPPRPLPDVAVDLPAVPLTELSALLREAVLRRLPEQLVVDTQHNWGHQAQVLSVQTVKVIHVRRNHGNWEKARAVAPDLAHNLELRARNLSSPGQERIAFSVHLGLPATVEIEKNIWQNGIEVLARRGRARLRVCVNATLETDAAAVSPGPGFPYSAADLKLSAAEVWCDGFRAENLDGLGGDFARLAGGLLERAFQPCQPSLEGEFRTQLCDALLHAAETPEVRAGLSRLATEALAARARTLQEQAAAAAEEQESEVEVWPTRGPVVGCPRAPAACPGLALLEFDLLAASRHAAPSAHPSHHQPRHPEERAPVIHYPAPVAPPPHTLPHTHEGHHKEK